MKCVLCKSNLVKGNINHILDSTEYIIIIKGLPANICKQCGEYYIEKDIALKLEKTIEDAIKIKAEILVINYSKMAT
ncbi:type II toxin-antitoxin system MqsA family antitoxin [Clostridium estertheticum]|uniref:type II toxin-antitoxin system MqsA family antitoxin n=1 Tax=Clostridium estertheticum TaxID=238834 RepID=UPI001C0B4320|nr:type II toxin-antitoxin system MqsA family antitoxin [Clostridium estertheticum]MBU3200311.1 type II toxin-antitoxin system MqsA family antitoxin [Clostridium estertheticum]WAG64481.1 type II toxin-antitoxin system MqsA family antitoxin [Clostridium estertheticum]